MTTTTVEVVFKIPLNQSFTYLCADPNALYKRVLVSLGKRQTVGFVIAENQSNSFSKSISSPKSITLKPILSILDEQALIFSKDFHFANWLAYYYSTSVGEALSLFFSFSMPTSKRKKNAVVATETRLNTSKRNLFVKNIFLSSEQKAIAQKIISRQGYYSVSLLHGVTGSGKTHVYLELIKKIITLGKQAILLVPEINLTPQIEKILRQYFSLEIIGTIHSKLTLKQKNELYKKIACGEIKIILGARSAIFAPTNNLGLIIIDEENDTSYKNNATPRYHIRQVAQYKCKSYKALLVLGSATPSIETYYYAQQGKINLHKMSTRYNDTLLPKTELISLQENDTDDDNLIPDVLLQKLYDSLRNDQQVAIYINKRAYASGIFCQRCRTICSCKRCLVTLNYHKAKNILMCHHCGYRKIFDECCESCGDDNLKHLGFGTEKLVEDLERRVDIAKILRFDSDTVRTAKQMKQSLDDFHQNKYNMIVGTQMLTKGHDFPNLYFVIILYPERQLSLPDFRSAERMFSQITQVSGRAGRRQHRGLVYIYTDMKQDSTIIAGQKQDYLAFYEKEIELRKEFNYPPFCRLFRLLLRSKKETKLQSYVDSFKVKLLRALRNNEEVLGPAPCVLRKIKHYYRWSYLIKLPHNVSVFLDSFNTFKKDNPLPADIYMECDLDPVELI